LFTFFLPNIEFLVTQRSFTREIPFIGKAYEYSFQVKIFARIKNWSSVFRVTTDRKKLCCSVGYRIPGVYFDKNSNDLMITNAINGNGNYIFKQRIPMNRYTRVRITQYLDCNDKYRYSIFFNDKEVFSIINRTPRTFENAYMFMGDPYIGSGNSFVQNFNFRNL